MFIKSFRLKTVLYGIAAGLLVAAIAGNLVAIGVRAMGESRETGAPALPSEAVVETAEGAPSSAAEPDKVVYLTFDDGPSAVTGELLDTLKEEQIPATFFVIGATTERGKKLYQRILDEGHALGIHSYSHQYSQIYKSADAYLADFDRLSDHLETLTGCRPTIFRFPGGSNNSHASKEVLAQIKKQMKKRGDVWFDWNAIAKDDKATATPAKQMFDTIVQTAGDKKRILILMHDDALRTTASECVRMLAKHYRALGYTFEKLTPETDPIQFG